MLFEAREGHDGVPPRHPLHRRQQRHQAGTGELRGDLGAIAVLVNTRFRSAEVQDIVGRSRAKALVLAPSFRTIDFAGILAAVDPTALDALLSFNPIPTVGAQNLERGFREWFDPTLLPPFETISKYFHFTVFGAKTSADGITFKTFAPLPPALRN